MRNLGFEPCLDLPTDKNFNSIIKTITVNKGDKPTEFSLNLEGVNVLTFQVKFNNGVRVYGGDDHKAKLAVGLVDIILE